MVHLKLPRVRPTLRERGSTTEESNVGHVIPACTVQRQNGTFCDAVSLEDAPFPICAHHALSLFTHLQDTLMSAGDATYSDVATDILMRNLRGRALGHAPRSERVTVERVVYYVQVGDLIKIGTTSTLRNRLSHFPPDSVLLATEPGGHDVEAARHRQFASLLYDSDTSFREWFHAAPELLDHIAQLRAVAA